MAKPITPQAGRPDSNPGNLHSLWMFITAISGIDDQASPSNETLKAEGVDVERVVASGQLLIDEGKSHPQELKDMLNQVLAEIPTKFDLLRWVGVMSWALKKV